jgi:hypothetical protein
MRLLRIFDYSGHVVVGLHQFLTLYLGVLVNLKCDRVNVVHQLLSLSKHYPTLSDDFGIEISLTLESKCLFVQKLLLFALWVFHVVVGGHAGASSPFIDLRINLLFVLDVGLGGLKLFEPGGEVRTKRCDFLSALFLSKN